MSGITALDLFAGTGWGVACQRLGIEEFGVEIMPEACATRDANGMRTIFNDVWDGLEGRADVPPHTLQIASPPCQTFSVAGGGAGRRALDDVLEAISQEAYKDAAALRAFGEAHDDRTALVLVPLAYAFVHRPTFIAWEQVPTVLPVWQACAEVLRGWGYSVDVGVLNAEQYGVPQTRKRAILVARNDGQQAMLPTPTHSRYYSRDPKRLDPGVLKWVSMAEALGGAGFDLVGNQVPPGSGRGEYHSRSSEYPAQTVTSNARSWHLRSNYSTSNGIAPEGNKLPRTERPEDAPASTITSKAGYMSWVRRGLESRPAPTITGGGTETGGAEPIAKIARYTESADWTGGKARLSIEEAAILQSYPMGGPVAFTANNLRENAATRPMDTPAPTITGGHDRSNRGFISSDGSFRMAAIAEVAELQSYPMAVKRMGAGMVERYGERPGRLASEPAFTLRASAGGREPGGFVFQEEDGETRKMTPAEGAVLQTYPPRPFVWKGSKSKQFLQIGNAVPPLLAQAVLASILSIENQNGEPMKSITTDGGTTVSLEEVNGATLVFLDAPDAPEDMKRVEAGRVAEGIAYQPPIFAPFAMRPAVLRAIADLIDGERLEVITP